MRKKEAKRRLTPLANAFFTQNTSHFHKRTLYSYQMKNKVLIVPIRNQRVLMKSNKKFVKIYNISFDLMNQSDRRHLILVYYNIRGKMQVIRNLLCYLGISFVELHLDLIEAGIETPDDFTLSQLKFHPIDRTKLPLLVDGNEFIYGTFAINLYVSTLAQRIDLFGKTDSQMRLVQKALESILQSQMKSNTFLFQFAQQCVEKSPQQIKTLLPFYYEAFMSSFPFLRQLCLKLEELSNRHFIFQNFTIVDFYFMESCFYILNIFGSLNDSSTKDLSFSLNVTSSHSVQGRSNIHFLNVMRQHFERMTQQPYYVAYKEYLECFPVFYSHMSREKIEGIRKLWVGNRKFLN